MKEEIMEQVTMVSKYGNAKPIVIKRNKVTHEVSYWSAVAAMAAANCACDYFPGLDIDRDNKHAWYHDEINA